MHIKSKCLVCGGSVIFEDVLQHPLWSGMLGFCWCGAPHRILDSELTLLDRPVESVLDLREPSSPSQSPRPGRPPTPVIDLTVAGSLFGAVASSSVALRTVLDHDLDRTTARALLEESLDHLDELAGALRVLVSGASHP